MKSPIEGLRQRLKEARKTSGDSQLGEARADQMEFIAMDGILLAEIYRGLSIPYHADVDKEASKLFNQKTKGEKTK